jgi:hypothetical protein
LRIGESIENYAYSVGDDETEIADKAVMVGATLRSTKLIINNSSTYPHEFVTTWEIHFTINIFSRKKTFSRICIESFINTDNDPVEVINPEVLQWMSPEELDNLRSRMIWEANYTLMGTFDPFFDDDIDSKELKSWSTDDLLRLLSMNEKEVNNLKENWNKKQTYKKFGL